MPPPLVYLILSLLFNGCAAHRLARGNDLFTVESLQHDLLSLASNPDEDVTRETRRLATIVLDTIETRRRENRMIGWPWANNGLVRLGLKPRGLCHHWAEDLLAALAPLKLKHYEIHWMVARKGTMREHNAILIAPKIMRRGPGIIKAREPALPVSSVRRRRRAIGGRAEIKSTRLATFEAVRGPGIIIDPWRNAGRTFWVWAAKDRYPWRDDPETLQASLP